MQHFLPKPPSNNGFYDSSLRYDLEPGAYFVFGSNDRGAHGKGAAADAVTQYGAHYGLGEGPAGWSYAVPTRRYISRYNVITMLIEEITEAIHRFVLFTQEHQERHFFVTALGTGLAGYPHHVIAPLFKGAINCWFPQEWRPYLT